MAALPVNSEPTYGCLHSLKNSVPKLFAQAFSKQLVVDCIVFVILCMPLLLPRCASGPAKVGFRCHDPSLIFPYKPDTVSTGKLMLYSVGGPFLVFASNEAVRAFVEAGLAWGLKNIVFIHFKAYCIFLFGLVIVILFTESIKCTVSELRPHFFDVCKPDFSKLNCTDENGVARYIEDYTCTGELADKKHLEDSRKSFPSGHTSIATYSAVYVALYLELRMYVTASYFLRPALQFMLLLMASLCAVTRITDHKHYYMDIVAGGFIGGTVAGLIFYKIAWKVIPIQLAENTPALSIASSMESGNGLDPTPRKVVDTTSVLIEDLTASLSANLPKSPGAV